MQTIILGLDAFDPGIFEALAAQNRLPHLAKFAQAGQYARFAVANPPQSEVSWTSIATGADPGVHGMFDFVHRHPATYAITPSLLQTRTNVMGTQFVPPHTALTLFEQATRQGYPATVLWWPATFPARLDVPVQTIPGLGTPDIQGRLGVGAVYSPDPDLAEAEFKTAVERLEKQGAARYRGSLAGPSQKGRQGESEIRLDFELETLDESRGRLSFLKTRLELQVGEWSPIIEVKFKAGLFISLTAITRAILTQAEPEPRLYFLPLQIHPQHSPWHYSAPPGFAKGLWKDHGPFLTLGWPQDTTALEEGWISDDQFLALCESIFETRQRVFLKQVAGFKEGVLANVFDTLDRIQHMFRQQRPEVVEQWYARLDALVGATTAEMQQSGLDKARLLVVSDHGFADFDYKVHLNQWLAARGYLKLKDAAGALSLQNADWPHSQAYAVGLNSLYLNLAGREGQGSLQPDQVEPFRQQLRQELLEWTGPDGRPVFQQVYFREQAFHGPFLQHAPDLVAGYAPGYRASAETGLGKWEPDSLAANQDHWHADHCIDPQAVPGVLFANRGLADFPNPSFRDIPALAIGNNLEHPGGDAAGPSQADDLDQKTVEERLKGLGYL